jgi:HEAT repeat protein
MRHLSAAIATIAILVSAEAQTSESGIVAFVHQTYIEGIPYDDVSRFDAASATPILLELLDDPKEEPYWMNIVVTLGMLGDPRAVDPLIAFLEKDRGRLTPAQYLAQSAVVMALGYLIHKSGNEKALDYLVDGADPESWSRRKVSWTSPYHRNDAERNRQLSTMSILGLGLSGHPRGAARLRSLAAESKTRGLDGERRDRADRRGRV